MIDRRQPSRRSLALWGAGRLRALLGAIATLGAVSGALAAQHSGPPGEDAWVESRLAAMTTAERIGQLLFARVGPDEAAAAAADVERYGLGGVVLDGLADAEVAEIADALRRAEVPVPALLAVDGLGPGLPDALTHGAANDPDLTRAIVALRARRFHAAGVHAAFGPAASLSLEGGGARAASRSFGADPLRTGRLAIAYARGLADAGLLAFATGFPGYGGARGGDAGSGVPVLHADAERVDTTGLVPYRMLAQDGIAGLVTGHLAAPGAGADLTASLSPELLGATLRNGWRFDGLVVSGDLSRLEALGDDEVPTGGQLAVEAIAAGNDVAFAPRAVPAAVDAMTAALAAGRISQLQLDASVRRVLRAKYRAGLAGGIDLAIDAGGLGEPQASTVDVPPVAGAEGALPSDLDEADLAERLYRRAVTVVAADGFPLPVVGVDSLRTAVVALGAPAPTVFQEACARYTRGELIAIGPAVRPIEQTRWREQLATYGRVIVGIYGLVDDPSVGYGVTEAHRNLLAAVAEDTRVLVVLFGTPYAAEALPDVDGVVVAYEADAQAQEAAAEVVYGATPGLGHLPVATASGLRVGQHVYTNSTYRLRVSRPRNAGFRESGLLKVDELVREAIERQATPGGVALAIHDGEVGMYRAYGRHTYDDDSPPVDETTVYDLASITKIAASTIALMRLHEQGVISVYDRLEDHLPWTEGTNKGGLVIRDVLAHQAQLKPWIPFYEATIVKADDGSKAYREGVYADAPDGAYNQPVTEQLYINETFRDTIYDQIATSELLTREGYRYSDLGFYIAASIVEEKTGQTLDDYVEQEFYRPLGLRTMGYAPLERMSPDRVPPTEEDDYFRFGRVHGYVHDMGAAMLGGVSGHAGLFSDAFDLATLMQMLLNEGYYGGRRYFKPETVRLFTTRHPESTRRGLGFDMAELSSRGSTNMTPLASAKTFGHLGFTGTCAWADPETGIVFVWLTNRTYPRMTPNTFGKENYRPRMQGAVYEALVEE